MIDDDAFEMVPLIQFQAGHVNPLDKVALCPLKHGKCGRARHASKLVELGAWLAQPFDLSFFKQASSRIIRRRSAPPPPPPPSRRRRRPKRWSVVALLDRGATHRNAEPRP